MHVGLKRNHLIKMKNLIDLLVELVIEPILNIFLKNSFTCYWNKISVSVDANTIKNNFIE
jgi:hypothetical protein